MEIFVRFFQISFLILYIFLFFIIGPLLIIRKGEILYGASIMLITLFLGGIVIFIFEYSIRNIPIKEVIITDADITLLKRNKKWKLVVPFKSIHKREVDEIGNVHYITNIDFKAPRVNFKRGTLSSNYLDDKIIEIIDEKIDKDLLN